MTPEFDWDDNLRPVPKDPISFRKSVESLQQSLLTPLPTELRAAVLGELGSYLCILDDPVTGESHLKESLRLTLDLSLGIQKEIQQKIRLGTALQYQKKFVESDLLFKRIIQVCEEDEKANVYLDFAWQHLGKSYFDQKKYLDARLAFEKALQIRKLKSTSKDLMDSTEKAIKRVDDLMNSG